MERLVCAGRGDDSRCHSTPVFRTADACQRFSGIRRGISGRTGTGQIQSGDGERVVRKTRSLCTGSDPLFAAVSGNLWGDPVSVRCQLSDLCRTAAGGKSGDFYPYGTGYPVPAVFHTGKPVPEAAGVCLFVGGRTPAGSPAVSAVRADSLCRNGTGHGRAAAGGHRHIPGWTANICSMWGR